MLVRTGTRVDARIHLLLVEIRHTGRLIACHERCRSRRQHVLEPRHYLDVLSHKPGAFATSISLPAPPCVKALYVIMHEMAGSRSGVLRMLEAQRHSLFPASDNSAIIHLRLTSQLSVGNAAGLLHLETNS